MNSRKSGPITLRFKNVGPVKDAEVELGDLTIIAGRNNTGKTYLVYTLYSFLQAWIARGIVLESCTRTQNRNDSL